jgi:hypothetical protein
VEREGAPLLRSSDGASDGERTRLWNDELRGIRDDLSRHRDLAGPDEALSLEARCQAELGKRAIEADTSRHWKPPYKCCHDATLQHDAHDAHDDTMFTMESCFVFIGSSCPS